VNPHDAEDIFPEEGWREPSDDAARLAVYILAVLTFLGGMAGSVYCGLLAFSAKRVEEELQRPASPADSYIFGTLSLSFFAMTVGSIYFLVRESRHWNLRKLTAEKVVAGIFLFAVAIGIIAVWILQSGSAMASAPVSAGLIFGAFGIFLLALAIGLAVAAYQALSSRPRRLGRGRVIARYALDDKLQRIDAHPCPTSDGLTPVVEVQFLEGEVVTFRASSAAYEFAKPGLVGVMFGARKRLSTFKPER
jgi:hypothetical protein